MNMLLSVFSVAPKAAHIVCGGELVHLRILAEQAEDRIERSRTATETADRVARALPKQAQARNALIPDHWAGWDA